LFVLLQEAIVLPEATSATVIRKGSAPLSLDLSDSNATSTLVLPGDVIKVTAIQSPSEFFFIGGQIKSPGQKAFHTGLTLTQAILASSGVIDDAQKVRISRQGTDGRLITTQYNLRQIQNGKVLDPVLQRGDRIEVDAR
jgi:protein involved in polysaccharide export with SLBB domain